MSRKIVITSGKGGVGKTSICANLGVKLAQIDKRVLLIDLDIGLNNLDVVMGVENKVVFDLLDVVQNKCRIRQALIRDFDNPTLYILPSIHTLKKDDFSIDALIDIVEGIEDNFDYILIDCPAGLDKPFERAVKLANEAIVVSTPHISSLRDADKTLSMLRNFDVKILGLVVNRVRGDMVLNKEMLDPEEVANVISQKLLAVVPEDDCLSSNGVVDNNQSSAGKSFCMLAENIEKGSEVIFDYTKKYRGIFGKFRQSLRRRA